MIATSLTDANGHAAFAYDAYYGDTHGLHPISETR